MARFAAAIALATVATALVLPEPQRPLQAHGALDPVVAAEIGSGAHEGLAEWLQNAVTDGAKAELGSRKHRTEPHDESHLADSLFQSVRERLRDDYEEVAAWLKSSFADGSTPDGNDHPGDHDHGHDHDHSEYTIYELISKSKYTTRFAKLVDKHPDIVKLLNDTKAEYTLFVPVDKVFENLPEHEKPSDELIERILRYHIGLGEYPARKIVHTYTIPTAYDEKWLGDEPQRLRTSVGFGGITVNFYSKVIAGDIKAKNGVIHAVNHILVPPPFIGKVISLLPSQFSTLLLAYEKTDFVKYIHGVKLNGTTVFAPHNGAFAWLGVRANAFLFNTEKGHKYLTALLKYQIVPNVTLYTDALYDKRGASESGPQEIDLLSTEHHDLPTLLGEAHLGVDIGHAFGFATIKVNGFTRVVAPNVPGANGVIQVVNRVLIPPHKKKEDSGDLLGNFDIKDLIERLEPYV